MASILVADDHPLNRHFLTTLLSYYGHDVREAADGADALEAARGRRPDLIIADVAMPRLDGPALVRALRADRELAGVPVVFYSASYREVESREIARAVGVEHVIAKPSDPQAILETVARALGIEESVRARGTVPSDAHEYIGRLQLAGIRMSALIDLMEHLSAERDPQELLHTGCRAVRKIFSADYAVMAAGGDAQTGGDVDPRQLEELLRRIAPLVGREPSRAIGMSEPLVIAAQTAMKDAWSAALLPMRSRGGAYGWMLLANRHGSPAFSLDDERLALAAARQIRAEHESLRAERVDRQRIEAALQTSREDLAALVDAAPVPIIAYDTDRRVRTWNAAAERTFGWRAEEVIGTANPSIQPEIANEFAALAEACLAGAIVTDIEQRRARKDGARVDVNLSMAALRDAEGKARGFVSIVNDITALRASRERLRALSARVLSIQEEERTRLARELHDGIGQLLTAVKIDASRLLRDITRGAKPPQRVTEGLLPLIDSTAESVVRLVSELRPTRIGEMGLVAAMEKKLAEFRRRTDIAYELRTFPEPLRVKDEVATAVFRVLEEALTNVARHSGATLVSVDVEQLADEIRLELRDNGRGIRDADRLAPDAYGLIGMQERAFVLGGNVDITAVEGGGTVVTARIPLGTDPGPHR